MRVLIVSGIWPPDVGGPASHAPDVAAFLLASGHEVEVVVTAAAAPEPRPYVVRYTSRRLPTGARHAHGLLLIARRALRADVVYTTGMFGRSGLAAVATRTPYVVKLTGDPAFERLRSRGAVGGDAESFQDSAHGVRAAALVRLRDFVVRHAAHIYTPSAHLRDLVIGWGVSSADVTVLPNPLPRELPKESRDELRSRYGFSIPTLVFAGRLTAQKSLSTLLGAVEAVDGVDLVIAGDGEERGALEDEISRRSLGDRVRLLGAQRRETVLELLLAADAAVLSSSWENFPHGVVEALAVGTPVIATAAGGVTEVVRDGENGLLVPIGDEDALAFAIRRYISEPDLRDRLRSGSASSVAQYDPAVLLGDLERTLVRVAS